MVDARWKLGEVGRCSRWQSHQPAGLGCSCRLLSSTWLCATLIDGRSKYAMDSYARCLTLSANVIHFCTSFSSFHRKAPEANSSSLTGGSGEVHVCRLQWRIVLHHLLA
eukprot:symbB.v1.2.017741.t1/scaffold1388.1/size124199/8